MQKRRFWIWGMALGLFLAGAVQVLAGWECPQCQLLQDGNFCSNCGMKRPQAESAELNEDAAGTERIVRLEALSLELVLDEAQYNIFEKDDLREDQLSVKRIGDSIEEIRSKMKALLEDCEVFAGTAGPEMFADRYAWITLGYTVDEDMEAFRRSGYYESYKQDGSWREMQVDGVDYLFRDIWSSETLSRETGDTLVQFQTITGGRILNLFECDSNYASYEDGILPDLLAQIGEALGEEKHSGGSEQSGAEPVFPYSADAYYSALQSVSEQALGIPLDREVDIRTAGGETQYWITADTLQPMWLWENADGSMGHIECEAKISFAQGSVDEEAAAEELNHLGRSIGCICLAAASAEGCDPEDAVLDSVLSVMGTLLGEADTYVQTYETGMKPLETETSFESFGRGVMRVEIQEDQKAIWYDFRWLPVKAPAKEGKRNIADM